MKALRAQGGSVDGTGPVERGFPNLQRHLENLARWGVPSVVALNRFPGDAEDDLERVRAYCLSLGAEAALCRGLRARRRRDGRSRRSRGCGRGRPPIPREVRPLYDPADTLDAKIEAIATRVYGADGVAFKPAARARLRQFEKLGYGTLPVCVAKTQYSFTDDPKVLGAPTGWKLGITDATLSAGAGFVVAVAGSMMLMPGLGKTPQALKLDVDDEGRVVGMDY